MKAMMIIMSALLIVSNNRVEATLAVIDSANLANSAKQVAAWGQQLAEMRNQLEQARQQYVSLTGNRGLSKILYNSELSKYLPTEFKDIYTAANSVNYGISGSIEDIAAAEKFTGSIADMQKHIEERSKRGAYTNKAVGLKAYEGANQRLKQIESLMTQISNTQDLKAISELQARISLEQATIQNEITKLQMISQLQLAEQKLVQEQKREMSRRILNSNNTEMPRIQ